MCQWLLRSDWNVKDLIKNLSYLHTVSLYFHSTIPLRIGIANSFLFLLCLCVDYICINYKIILLPDISQFVLTCTQAHNCWFFLFLIMSARACSEFCTDLQEQEQVPKEIRMKQSLGRCSHRFDVFLFFGCCFSCPPLAISLAVTHCCSLASQDRAHIWWQMCVFSKMCALLQWVFFVCWFKHLKWFLI